jgi:hypothetical protein
METETWFGSHIVRGGAVEASDRDRFSLEPVRTVLEKRSFGTSKRLYYATQ